MTLSRMFGEAERWVETASEDLRAARVLYTEQLFAHACFMAQQCGEKSVKAMWYAIGQEPAGQSIQKLVMQFPETQHIPDMQMWRQYAAVLDKFFSATRYPNELPDLAPSASYFAHDADQAMEYANVFLRTAREMLRTPQPILALEPTRLPPVSPSLKSLEPKIDLSSSAFRAQSSTLLPPKFENTSSGEDHPHRRRHHSKQSRVKRFFMQKETWIVAAVLIISAILLGLMITFRGS